ncbi:MAG: hypothetical protein HQM08_12565 [Candidatus Riflebacteria bacterium]|nr:hypothetical protein [Candidatus Riflebacteria bacterium]
MNSPARKECLILFKVNAVFIDTPNAIGQFNIVQTCVPNKAIVYKSFWFTKKLINREDL